MENEPEETDILCPSCTDSFTLDSAAASDFGVYCPYCGAPVSDAEIEAQTT
jgi:uncharacterized Zn-finger protein